MVHLHWARPESRLEEGLFSVEMETIWNLHTGPRDLERPGLRFNGAFTLTETEIRTGTGNK